MFIFTRSQVGRICVSSHLTTFILLVSRLIVLLTIIVAFVILLLLHGHTIGICLILLLTIVHAFLSRTQQSHIVLVAGCLVPIGALTEHNDLVLRLCVLPASEDEQVRTDSSASMTEASMLRLSQILSSLPAHGIG